MSDVWADAAITNQSELLVLLAIADYANDEGEAWPSIESIATKSRSICSSMVCARPRT